MASRVQAPPRVYQFYLSLSPRPQLRDFATGSCGSFLTDVTEISRTQDWMARRRKLFLVSKQQIPSPGTRLIANGWGHSKHRTTSSAWAGLKINKSLSQPISPLSFSHTPMSTPSNGVVDRPNEHKNGRSQHDLQIR